MAGSTSFNPAEPFWFNGQTIDEFLRSAKDPFVGGALVDYGRPLSASADVGAIYPSSLAQDVTQYPSTTKISWLLGRTTEQERQRPIAWRRPVLRRR